ADLAPVALALVADQTHALAAGRQLALDSAERQPPEVESAGASLDRDRRNRRPVAAAGQRQPLPARANQPDPQRVPPGRDPGCERQPSIVDDDLSGSPPRRRQAAAAWLDVLLGP